MYRRIMVGHTATVSTFVTVVGQPYSPAFAGNGGFRRGIPYFPSILSNIPYILITYSFFSADIGSSPVHHINVKIIARITRVFPYKATFISLIDCFLQPSPLDPKLSLILYFLLVRIPSDKNVSCVSFHGKTYNQSAL